MFPLFTIFLTFIVVLNITLHRQRRTQEAADKEFWDKELAANNTRRQDIEHLDYITIPEGLIPQTLGTDSEKELAALSAEKLMNLTDQSNTDLKLKYGVANLETLSRYEDNFTRYVALVPVYAAELADSGDRDSAKALLEHAVLNRADSCQVYTRLAGLYCEDGQISRAKELLTRAKALDSISGRIITDKLQQLIDAQP